MKIKILDFLLTLGKICEEQNGVCLNCPLSIGYSDLMYRCARNWTEEKQNAELVKKVVLERMKMEKNG